MRAQGIIQGNVGRLLKRFISKPSYFGRKCSLFGGERRIPFLASLSSCYFQETIIFKRSFPEFPRKYVYQKTADIKKETGTRKPHTTVVLSITKYYSSCKYPVDWRWISQFLQTPVHHKQVLKWPNITRYSQTLKILKCWATVKYKGTKPFSIFC